jgi:ADP-ribose pyrophosphatase
VTSGPEGPEDTSEDDTGATAHEGREAAERSTDQEADAAGRTPAASHVGDLRGLDERVVDTRTVHRGRYLDCRVLTIERADGSRSTRDIVWHPGAVAMVALDENDRVLLVRQFRIATGHALLEIPAGTLDVDAATGRVEDPDAAAGRELEEETGYRAGHWERIGDFWTAPGFATERMWLYLATDLRPADLDRLGPDDDEHLELKRVPWRDAVEMADRGEIRDAKSLVGLFRLARLRA